MYQIRSALPKTFEWIWQTVIVDWFGSMSRDFFWISGKPGSGKSTLMKYLATTMHTSQYLPGHAQDWIKLEFYFDFRAESGTGNTYEGMIRSFAVQLTECLPETAVQLSRIFVERHLTAFPNDALDQAFCRIVKTCKHKILAFVDGLDECSEDHEELIRSLVILADRTRMRICVACREQSEFLRAFGGSPRLRMQDHNQSTIRAFVQDTIDSRQYDMDPRIPFHLKDIILNKSQGVILWARFATLELIDGWMGKKTDKQLEAMLDSLPQELEEMYQRILDGIKPRQKKEVARILHLIQEAGGGIDLQLLHEAWAFTSFPEDVSPLTLQNTSLPGFETRLVEMSGGLLDVTAPQYFPNLSLPKQVTLLHKTLELHLKNGNWAWNNSHHSYQGNYPNASWLRIATSVLKYAYRDTEVDRREVDPLDAPDFMKELNFPRLITSRSLLTPDLGICLSLSSNAFNYLLKLCRDRKREYMESHRNINQTSLEDWEYQAEIPPGSLALGFKEYPQPLRYEALVPMGLLYAALQAFCTGPVAIPRDICGPALSLVFCLATYTSYQNPKSLQMEKVQIQLVGVTRLPLL
ncbi:MAG: hypothetical protein Q9220_000389 [cf. Caloplaca sp. 1 TL-2023]